MIVVKYKFPVLFCLFAFTQEISGRTWAVFKFLRKFAVIWIWEALDFTHAVVFIFSSQLPLTVSSYFQPTREPPLFKRSIKDGFYYLNLVGIRCIGKELLPQNKIGPWRNMGRGAGRAKTSKRAQGYCLGSRPGSQLQEPTHAEKEPVHARSHSPPC